MTTDGRTAIGHLTLRLSPKDPAGPEYDSYQLRFADLQGRENPRPIRHRVEVIRDLPPEVQLVEPQQEEVQVAADGKLAIKVWAKDPDFALRRVTLRAQHDDKSLPIAPLLDKTEARSGMAGRVLGRLHLPAGKAGAEGRRPGGVLGRGRGQQGARARTGRQPPGNGSSSLAPRNAKRPTGDRPGETASGDRGGDKGSGEKVRPARRARPATTLRLVIKPRPMVAPSRLPTRSHSRAKASRTNSRTDRPSSPRPARSPVLPSRDKAQASRARPSRAKTKVNKAARNPPANSRTPRPPRNRRSGSIRTPIPATPCRKSSMIARSRASNSRPTSRREARNRASRQPVARRPAARRPAAKRLAARRPVARRPAAKRLAARRLAARRPAVRRPAARKLAARRPAARKPAAKGRRREVGQRPGGKNKQPGGEKRPARRSRARTAGGEKSGSADGGNEPAARRQNEKQAGEKKPGKAAEPGEKPVARSR